MSQDSVNQILKQINQTCRTKGGKYADYSCKTVSWDDVQRGNVDGNLSCWGSNITDTYLNAKDGRRLFTVRSDNWNEKLGHMTTKDIALVQGNQNEEASEKTLSPITLRTFLENAGKYGEYAKLDSEMKLDNLDLDQKVSVRFQTTFLPVENKEKSTLEFCTEAYNYNTRDDADPRNLILLCTTQGIALQQDGAGTKKIYHHDVNEKTGEIERYWLEAERSSHKVGGQQVESKEEKEDAIKRGKATSSVIGIKAMGTRFNVLMTIQIPLEQQIKKKERKAKGIYKAMKGLSLNYSAVALAAPSNSMMMMKCSAPVPMMDEELGCSESEDFYDSEESGDFGCDLYDSAPPRALRSCASGP